jgi:hypothetical protein
MEAARQDSETQDTPMPDALGMAKILLWLSEEMS